MAVQQKEATVLIACEFAHLHPHKERIGFLDEAADPPNRSPQDRTPQAPRTH